MSSVSLSRSEYGKLSDGETVYEYCFSNAAHVSVRLITRGCTITSVVTPSASGECRNVVLGFPSLQGWLQPQAANFNSVVGRYANRIRHGRFALDGRQYQLAVNNPPNHLHGGTGGFYSRNWKEVRQIAEPDRVGVVLSYTSRDGEEGYPGELEVVATYCLTTRSAWVMDWTASAAAPTILNVCNHAYWNLSGDYGTDVLQHRLLLPNSPQLTPVDDSMIPTGELRPVAGSHHDFSSPTVIGSRIAAFQSVDKACNGGYDHNYVVVSGAAVGSRQHADAASQTHCATLTDDASGRCMDVFTTAPGVQLYTGNFLDGSLTGREGRGYAKHAGLCLETQVWPDSPNQPAFPNCVLRPGQSYRHTTTHVFYTINNNNNGPAKL